MTSLFSLSYLFNMRPGGLHFIGMMAFFIAILIFIIIIFLFTIAKKRKNNIYFRVWRALNTFAVTNLILALFLFFFEYEEIYIFAARFWLVLWALSMLVWLIFVFREFKKIPAIKEEHEKNKAFNKYIP